MILGPTSPGLPYRIISKSSIFRPPFALILQQAKGANNPFFSIFYQYNNMEAKMLSLFCIISVINNIDIRKRAFIQRIISQYYIPMLLKFRRYLLLTKGAIVIVPIFFKHFI